MNAGISKIWTTVQRTIRTPVFMSLCDQALQSGTNFAAIICLAAFYPKNVVGEFVLITTILQISLGFQRSLVVLPFIVSQSGGRSRSNASGWFFINSIFLVGNLAVLFFFATVSYILGIRVISSQVFALSAIPIVTAVAYEYCRRWAYQFDERPTALISAVALSVFYILGMAGSVLTGYGLWPTILGYSIGGIVAVWIILTRHGIPLAGFGSSLEEWRQVSRSTGWHFLSFMGHSSYSSAMPLVIASVGSVEMIAVFGATRSMVTPLLAIATALDSIEKPRLGKAFFDGGIYQLCDSARRVAIQLSVIAAPGVLMLSIFGAPILGVVFGPQYIQYHTTLLLWCVSVVFTLLNQPVETSLIIIQKGKHLFAGKLVASVLGLCLAILLIQKIGTSGAVLATALATLTSLLFNTSFVYCAYQKLADSHMCHQSSRRSHSP